MRNRKLQNMRVLVTGASGYIGGRLIPLLLKENHQVIASFTDLKQAEKYWWAGQVELIEMDVTKAKDVVNAVKNVDAVYYLIHGMGGDDFVEVDRKSAQNMSAAVKKSAVQRIIYLSGLVPDVAETELSDHISSRLEVEEILTSSGKTTITLRAAVVTGSGSTSFEVIRQISQQMKLQTIPSWMKSQVQPIAAVDVLTALVGALTAPAGSRTYDVGGPEKLPYHELLKRFAEIAGLSRTQLEIPLLPTQLVGAIAGRLIDVPTATVQALVESLPHDMVCREADFIKELLPKDYSLLDVEQSFKRSLAQPAKDVPDNSRDLMGPLTTDPDWSGNVTPLSEKITAQFSDS